MTEVTERALNAAGAKVTYLRDPHDRAIRRALDDEVDSVIVISNDDNASLRLALVVENVRPGVPLVVTVFGGIVASQLRRAVRNVRVMSMADIVVPSLAGPAVGQPARGWLRGRPGRPGRPPARADPIPLASPRPVAAVQPRLHPQPLRGERSHPHGGRARLPVHPPARHDGLGPPRSTSR